MPGVALPSPPHFEYRISPIITCGREPGAPPAHASNQPRAGCCGNCFGNAQERGRRATHGLPAGLRGSPSVTSSPACTAVCCPHIKSTWLTPLGEENLFLICFNLIPGSDLFRTDMKEGCNFQGSRERRGQPGPARRRLGAGQEASQRLRPLWKQQQDGAHRDLASHREPARPHRSPRQHRDFPTRPPKTVFNVYEEKKNKKKKTMKPEHERATATAGIFFLFVQTLLLDKP